MGEIDDTYKESVEEAENFFFEDLKKGKKRKRVLDGYHKSLDIARKKFEKTYEKKLRKDKILASKIKRKKENRIRYKRLKVEHFEFEFSFWQRFLINFKIWWFNLSRFFKKKISSIIPSFLLYWHYKFWITLKSFLREVIRKKNKMWNKFKHFIIKLSHDLWKKIVILFHFSIKKLKWLLSKIFFWRKKEKIEGKEDEKSGESKETEEKTEEKNEEEKG